MAKLGKINRWFLFWTIILVVSGFFIFSSASLGELARNEIKFSNIAFNQIFYGLFLGSIACLFFARVDYRIWKKYSFVFFMGSIFLTLLVFIPGIGIEHGGAKRWIDLGFVSFQPAEFLKIAFIMYFAAWLSRMKNKVGTISWGLAPFLLFFSLLAAVLLTQPDTDTFAVIIFAALAMYIASGARWRHVGIILIIGALLLYALCLVRPYVKQRIEVMLNPSLDSQTTGYQLNQSLIAIGSGGVWGRGFGQSIQKFRYLPEPIGDSVFAVAAEEFGFVGASILIAIFIIFALQGLKISSGTKDNFGRLLCLGIVILIVFQALINIGGIIGILPLTGIPLPFVSHGGTALFITLVEAGIIMNISRNSRK
ncbi:MAG: putative lipid II flippase FtsW [Candidatus Zambryskibacteria bacterium]|nr:putative lipid II flippase FtsW [Candidatus Zambryskibacteria bacterium]